MDKKKMHIGVYISNSHIILRTLFKKYFINKFMLYYSIIPIRAPIRCKTLLELLKYYFLVYSEYFLILF